MKSKLLTLFSILVLFFGYLQAQLDPTTMAEISQLSPAQKQQLIKQYRSDEDSFSQSIPTAQLPNRAVEIEQPEGESFEDRADFLDDLKEMETMVSEDILMLKAQIDEEDSSENIEILQAMEESKALFSKVKLLQRREIEKRAEQFGKSKIDAIKPFGYDLFASDPSTYAPGNEVPIPTDYRIGPGDLVEIQLFGQRNDSFSLGISREGLIRFPGIGPIHAFEQGTSFIDLKNHLKEKIREHLGEGVQSSITLGAFRSIRIFLLGEVRKQGAYTVSALSTTVNALLSCGGIKESGSLRRIQLKRAGKTVSTLDLYDLLLHGDSSADQPLQPGDVIYVPVVQNQISVTGAVKRSAKYEILGGETLAKVIELSGGPSDRSVLNMIRLERLNFDYRMIVKNLSFEEHKNFVISSGDHISVGFANSRIKNVVSLIGAVENVGDYEWQKGLQLKDLIGSADDFLTKIDLQYGLIRRKKPDGSYSCIAFKPNELVAANAQPIFLKSQDLIYFLSRDPKAREEMLAGLLSDLRNQAQSGKYAEIVRIAGSVHFPGEYPLTKEMSLTDLLYAGGGTRDSAYMLDAEISRVVVGVDQIATVKHIRIDQRDLIDEDNSKSFKLQPYDVLSIKPIPLWREGESVELLGELKFPGTYSLKAGETLTDVINRAGGLTERAFAKGAIFSRENLRDKEDEQKERLIAQLESDLAKATLTAKDAADAAQARSAANAMISRLRDSESQGRLVINLEQILSNSSSMNLLVKSGDILTVPQIPYAVSVSGEVQYPSSHLYDKSLDLNNYLNRSGGFTQNADKDRTFVVKANGAVMSKKGGNAWFSKVGGNTQMEAGDVIVVPIDIKQTRFLENLTYGTQIIYQLSGCGSRSKFFLI